MSRAKHRLFVLISIFLAVLGTAILLELGMAGYYLLANRGYVSVATLLAREQNTFVRELKGDHECTYLDHLFPHPYLGHVHHANPPCGNAAINNVGLFGPDYPVERDPGKFTILLTGGSVAASMEGLNPTQGRLQAILNARYESPNGKEFLVLRGGDGAWKQPQQTILFLLHARAVDAVVTLDGFNEVLAMLGQSRLDVPSSNFFTVNPRLEQSERRLIAVRVYSAIYEYSKRNWLLSRSYAAYGLSKTARELIRAYGERERAGAQKTTVPSLFALPDNWDDARRRAWNIEEYAKYVRVMDATTQRLGVKRAFFLQPVPAIEKTLTAEERQVVDDLGYRDLYQRIVSALLSLRSEGVPVISLLNVFADVTETIYADPVHCVEDSLTGESLGYQIMASRLADELATAWRMRRKARPGA
jgi:hypothetical protein